jgi:superfamily II DNA or RNA helicase
LAPKTVIALAGIAARKQPTLVIVHTKELQAQWVSRIGTCLGIPPEKVGLIGNGKRTVGQKITVALVQSLYKCADEVAPDIGFLVVDECHRAPPKTFTEAVTAFDCKYMLGLSATPWRRDGLSKLIFWHVGDVIQVEKVELIDRGDVLRAHVIVRETAFQTSFDPSEEYTRMLSELTQDRGRNVMIAQDVISQANNGGGICLVLSDRKAHCLELQELIEGLPAGVQTELLTGDVPTKERQAIIERLNGGKVKVLMATGQLIGEGFDCRALSILFLATPIKFDGRLLQYLGRVLRPAPGKERAVVYDYVDTQVGVLKAAFHSRRRVYANG